MNSKSLIIFFVFLIGCGISAQETRSQVQEEKTITTGCLSGDCSNGWGEMVFEDGYYQGFWLDGKRNGYGLFDWNESGKYIGFWVDDSMTGYGVYIGKNKDIVGEFKDGFLQGMGYIVEGGKWEQGRYDKSILVDSFAFDVNGVEMGCIAGDCVDRYGRYNWSNGDSFTGFFREGKMFLGSLKLANGNKYTGQFNIKNEYHGQGRLFFSNGDYYGGEWKNGKYHGKGYFQGQIEEDDQIGTWNNGVFVGPL